MYDWELLSLVYGKSKHFKKQNAQRKASKAHMQVNHLKKKYRGVNTPEKYSVVKEIQIRCWHDF